ncbi:MAG: tetratricopeptide repeat protein [Chitinophagaceae bacterium]|nr:tetratricopeptide repeat protein [Chitinophagaceae bacterium]
MNRLILLWMICCAPVWAAGQITSVSNAQKEVDSLEAVMQAGKTGIHYIDAGIRLGGRYMDFSQPGKAQEILEKILPVTDSLAYDKGSYFTRSYLAEIFFQAALYDNALYMLKRAAAFAHTLKDDELIADSWNIMGLIYQEMQMPDSALTCFKNSLALMPVQKKNFLESSYRYQVLSNLAQVFLQTGKTDSTWQYMQASFREADALQAYRGMAIAKYYMGAVIEGKDSAAKAMEYYRTAIAYARIIDDKDVVAFIYPSVVSALYMLKVNTVSDSVAAYDAFLKKNEDRISLSTQKEYYSRMTEVFAKYKNEKVFLYQQQLNDIVKKINNEAMRTRLPVLSNLVNNEKKLATLEQEKVIHAQQLRLNRSLVFFLAVLLTLLSVVLYFVIKTRKQKQQLAVQKVKNDISAALHDEVAASLTGINLFGKLAEEALKDIPGNAGLYTKKMQVYAESLAGYIADMVWIIDPEHNKGAALANKLNISGAQQGDHAIAVQTNEAFAGQTLPAQMRKDLYLLCKRLLHCICLEEDNKNSKLELLQKETGIVLHLSTAQSPATVTEDEIIKNKMETLHAIYNITNSGQGYILKVTIPFAAKQDIII